MYKLLISDFEDTLLNEEDAIPLSTMLALDNIRSKNVAYGIISRRYFRSVLDYNKDFPFVDYIVVLDGAYIYDVKKDKPLFKRNISISIIKKIKKVFDDYNLCFYTLDWCNYTKESIDGDNVRKIGDFKVFSDFHKDNIYKIEIRFNNKKDKSNIVKELDNLNLDIEYFVRDNCIEIIMSECGRLNAIQKISKARKNSLKEVVFIGSDDDNIASFKKVGLSYAVDNSSNKLKKVADYTVGTNLDKAVEEVINECFNKE